MENRNIISRWAVLLLAEILNLSATVAEKVLFGQPRWVAQLRLLEANLRNPQGAPSGGSPGAARGESAALSAETTRQVLESYAILSRKLKDIEARGLALDDVLVERMNSEWSPKSIVSFLMTCDTQLKHDIGEVLKAAAEKIGEAPALAADPQLSKRRKDLVS